VTFTFWREGVDGRKIRSKCLRSIFNPTHHFVNLCLDILAVRMVFVRKRCGRKFGWSVLVDSSPILIFGTLSYSRVPSQLTSCVGTTKVKIMVSTKRGDYSTPEKNPPRPLECSPASRRPVTLATFALPAAAAFGSKIYNVNKLTI